MKNSSFKDMPKDRHLEISSKGGLACHAGGKAFGFTKKTASEAGKKSAQIREKIFFWMEANASSYEDELDLAADTCSTFSCWKEDLSVPSFILMKAKRIFKKVSK